MGEPRDPRGTGPGCRWRGSLGRNRPGTVRCWVRRFRRPVRAWLCFGFYPRAASGRGGRGQRAPPSSRERLWTRAEGRPPPAERRRPARGELSSSVTLGGGGSRRRPGGAAGTGSGGPLKGQRGEAGPVRAGKLLPKHGLGHLRTAVHWKHGGCPGAGNVCAFSWPCHLRRYGTLGHRWGLARGPGAPL